MKDKNCNGFTLVELLVVIAILAVLATVSVVGYTTFIQKANAANDKAVVAQIYNILIADEVVNGQPSTIGEVLKIIDDNGLEISEILPTAKGHEIVYDISSNSFALLKNGNVVFANEEISYVRNLWKFVDNPTGQDYFVPETTENSLFLTNPAKTVTLASLVGIEGTIETLNITDETSTASIVVAGDIGQLKIDAPYATVDHYGVVKVLDITRIGTDCYKEHGFLVELEYFGTGKFVVCEGAQFAQSQEEIAKVLGGENNADVLAYENTAVQSSENIFDQKHNYIGESPHTCFYEQISGNATCTESGIVVQKCVICGNEIANEVQEPLGHDYQETITQQPTCTETGTKTYTCKRCNYSRIDVLAALGHTEVVDEAIAATCTTTGKTEGKHCAICNAVIVAQEEIAKNGHTEEVVSGKAATCTETGMTEGKKCSVCNEILTAQEEIASLGHADDNADGKCDRCGAAVKKTEVWTLVTSTDQLKNGDTIIIASAIYGCAMSREQTESTLTATDITLENNRLVSPNITILRFKITQDTYWQFYSETFNEYLYAVGENTLAFAENASSIATARWLITVNANGVAEISCCYPECKLQYDPSQRLFTCSTSTSAIGNIVLYKLEQQISGN